MDDYFNSDIDKFWEKLGKSPSLVEGKPYCEFTWKSSIENAFKKAGVDEKKNYRIFEDFEQNELRSIPGGRYGCA